MQLNMEQKRLIQAKPNGHVLIKGVAGSGKTTVAVHRIPFLLTNYCFGEDDNVLMVTYNKTLVNYIQHLYEKVEEENQMPFQDIFGKNKKKVDIHTIDSILYKYFSQYKKHNKQIGEVISDSRTKYAILSACVAELKKEYSNINILDHRNISFLMDEIDWIKSCNYMEIEEYQNADRLGRMNHQSKEGPQKLMKNSNTRKAIFDLMILYNERLKEKRYIDFKDMALIALEQAKKMVGKRYTHIIIDESQDLTRVQLEVLKLMYQKEEYSSIYFITDTAQSIYPHSWLVKGRSFTTIGFDMTGKSNTLAKNYRTTTQIAQAAYSLIEKDQNIIDDENFVKPSLIDRQGYFPVYRWFRQPQNELNSVAKEIQGNLIKRYDYKDIVVIAKNRNQLHEAKEYFDKLGIPCNIITKKDSDFQSNMVKLLTMHSIKGLEFKVVFIIGLNEGLVPFISYQDIDDESVQMSNDRKLLYVGMTRANELLYLSSSGTPSPFIKEINHNYLRINSYSKFRKYYDIRIDNYAFREKIFNLYSKEEKVRQWVIKELKQTYKYPSELIDVEYKVNSFSAVGSVDIAVSIYNNNNLIPFIFIEVKYFGTGVKEGFSQLKSYMSHSKTCQYGIVTDGNELIVINNEHEKVDDIPPFHTSMLPSSIEKYIYNDLKHNCEYEIIRDPYEPYVLTVKEGEGVEETIYSDDNTRGVSIYGNIAAGVPLYMNEEIGERFYLPNEWLQGQGECFMLEVKGDSMQDAGIHYGDYVLVRKQQEAYNRDIVVVAINDDATMKRWMKMGDTILLIPENNNYEPIQIQNEQANILGLVIGVVKKI
ncbi:SOS-response repressor and protease LexA [Candidatus Syntrophocurvum alkaliphilum]|uniref:DNA 3'-5' helicase n=1 Tax=Candidatus Syntrophocurvum alkaliphilum TaxID=2293317 RepID=A0A6I6DBW9_9FIRM|nr:transcriptional repressor LexA [Candidatus Syntrophocurvum alkaliphilum]QGT99769.1 SOS-response repressor and protease LexA [Candidatus Syntrophocurvum alkaliphilum]